MRNGQRGISKKLTAMLKPLFQEGSCSMVPADIIQMDLFCIGNVLDQFTSSKPD
jgi:hypothetical protein